MKLYYKKVGDASISVDASEDGIVERSDIQLCVLMVIRDELKALNKTLTQMISKNEAGSQ